MNRIKALCLAAAAGTMALVGQAAHADTIQALTAAAPTNNFNGTWTYHYALKLTANNGLVGSPDSHQSALVFLDFHGYVSHSISASGGDLTLAGDWDAFTPATGAAGLPNSDYGVTLAGKTTLEGFVGTATLNAAGTDTGVTNLVLHYDGAGLAVAGVMRDLIHLDVVSNGSPGNLLATLSRDTAGTLGTERPAETFLAAGPNVVPLPAAAWGGLALMGAIGTSQIRKRRKEAAI